VWHDLRHTFSTRLLDEEVPELVIMALMGHKTRAMTGRYAHCTPAALRRAVDGISASKAEVLEFGRKASPAASHI